MFSKLYRDNPYLISKEDLLAYSLLLIYYSIMIAIAGITQGTGDDGDSVYHFLFAKYAFTSPENFVDQWAKPVFVLLSSPFAQFGFTGIKIFNVIVTTLAILFTYKIARNFRMKNSWLVVVILCCAPMYTRLTLSGLTEPLFALAFTVVIFLTQRQKLFSACLLASFLPFMRSEGLIILCVYSIYLLLKRKWKFIPLLLTGHLIYSIVGWFYYKDFLWVFTKLSYAVWVSAYGSGSPLGFVYGMLDYIGIPLTILFCIGTVWALIVFSKDIFLRNNFNSEEFWLVYGGFFSVWVSHIIFWNFGLFNSFGLVRVLIAVIPCAGIICLRGMNVILEQKIISSNILLQKALTGLIIIVLFINLFFQLKASCAFDLSGNQKATLKAANKYREKVKGYTMYSTSAYSSYVFDYNNFDSTQHRKLQEINTDRKIPSKSAIIWDDYYAAFESRIALSNLLLDDRFELLDTFHSRDCEGYINTAAVFLYKDMPVENWVVKDTIFKNDFESENFPGRESNYFFSGRYSILTNETNPYSPGFTQKVNGLGFPLPATIRIGAMFFTKKIPFNSSNHGVFVVSLEHNSAVYFWQGINIDNILQVGNTWGKVSFKLEIPAATDTSDLLKIYVWNPHPLNLYMDDFIVEELELIK